MTTTFPDNFALNRALRHSFADVHHQIERFAPIERDLHFTPKPLSKVREDLDKRGRR